MNKLQQMLLALQFFVDYFLVELQFQKKKEEKVWALPYLNCNNKIWYFAFGFLSPADATKTDITFTICMPDQVQIYNLLYVSYGNTGCGVFKGGIQN